MTKKWILLTWLLLVSTPGCNGHDETVPGNLPDTDASMDASSQESGYQDIASRDVHADQDDGASDAPSGKPDCWSNYFPRWTIVAMQAHPGGIYAAGAALQNDKRLGVRVSRQSTGGRTLWETFFPYVGKGPWLVPMAVGVDASGSVALSVALESALQVNGKPFGPASPDGSTMQGYRGIIKLDSNGKVSWAKASGPGWSETGRFVHDVVVLDDGRVVVGDSAEGDLQLSQGFVLHGTHAQERPFLASFDSHGGVQWVQQMPVWKLEGLRSGEVEVLTTRMKDGKRHAALVRLAPDGTELGATLLDLPLRDDQERFDVVFLGSDRLVWQLTYSHPDEYDHEAWHSLVVGSDSSGRVLWKKDMGESYPAIRYSELQCVGTETLSLVGLPSGRGFVAYGRFCRKPRLVADSDQRLVGVHSENPSYTEARNSFVASFDRDGHPKTVVINRVDAYWGNWSPRFLDIVGDRAVVATATDVAQEDKEWKFATWCNGQPVVPSTNRTSGTVISAAPLSWFLGGNP